MEGSQNICGVRSFVLCGGRIRGTTSLRKKHDANTRSKSVDICAYVDNCTAIDLTSILIR